MALVLDNAGEGTALVIDTADNSIRASITYGVAQESGMAALSPDGKGGYVCIVDPKLGYQTVIVPLDFGTKSATKPISLGSQSVNMGCAGLVSPAPGTVLAELSSPATSSSQASEPSTLIKVDVAKGAFAEVAELPGTSAGVMAMDPSTGVLYIARYVAPNLVLAPFSVAEDRLETPLPVVASASHVTSIAFGSAAQAWVLVNEGGGVNQNWLVPLQTAAHTAGSPITLSVWLAGDIVAIQDSLYMLASQTQNAPPALLEMTPAGSTPKQLLALPATWAAHMAPTANGKLVISMGKSDASAQIGIFDPSNPSSIAEIGAPIGKQAGPDSVATAGQGPDS